MYVEPCCAENQLPRLLRQSGAHAVMFQTAGDVTISHLMKAVMLLSGDRPRTLTIAVPSLSPELIRLLRRYMQQEWVAHLNLITTATPDEHNTYALLSEVGVPMDRITYAPVADASCMGLLMFAGSTHTVAIQGHLEPAPTTGLHLYSALLGPSGSPALRSFTDPITALIKARAVEIEAPKAAEGQSPAATSEAMSPSAEAQPMAEKPKAVRKKSRTPKGQNKL